MKYLKIVLFIVGSLLGASNLSAGFFFGGPTAGISVSHNIENTIMLVWTQRDGEFKMPVYANGVPLTIPVCGLLPGGETIVTASFYDKATFDPFNREASYLGSATRKFYVRFDRSGRYADSWLVTYYNKRQEPRNQSIASRVAATSKAQVGTTSAPAPVPSPGGIQVMNNIQGVKIVVSSSEDGRIYPPLTTGQTMSVPVGVDPQTRRFVLVAKVYSLTGGYLGYSDFRDSIDERRGYGSDRAWTIDRYTPVRAQAKR